MKLLLEKNMILDGVRARFILMLDDEFASGKKKDENDQNYILNIHISKGSFIKNDVIVKKVQDILSEYFLNSNDHRKALYVPSVHEISIYGEGYIDTFYNHQYKHPKLDEGYETDDGEIGKNLMAVHLDEGTASTNAIKIEFKSIFLVDELYRIQTLWDIGEGAVYNFLLDEVSMKIKQFTL